METCYRCSGKKVIKSSYGSEYIKCYICNGTGFSDVNKKRWIENGEYIREKRIKHNRSIYQEAMRLGVSIKKYSDIENGNIENWIYIK